MSAADSPSLALVPYQQPPTRRLQARLITLGREQDRLAELEAAYAERDMELRSFRKRWDPAVGSRYVELEELREKIVRAWAEIRKARSGELIDMEAARRTAEAPQPAFRPEVELRKTFRELARLVHPDRASDSEDRRRRHEFMAEASRAYRDRDFRRLQWLLEHWLAAPAVPLGRDADSQLERANQRLAWVRYRIRELNVSLAELNASSLARWLDESREAAREGRNLIAEMRNQVVQDLERARADLAAVEAELEAFEPGVRRIVRANAGF